MSGFSTNERFFSFGHPDFAAENINADGGLSDLQVKSNSPSSFFVLAEPILVAKPFFVSCVDNRLRDELERCIEARLSGLHRLAIDFAPPIVQCRTNPCRTTGT
jgi:hypothetical protein